LKVEILILYSLWLGICWPLPNL